MSDLTPEQCRRVLDEGAIAHIAVISDGEPYVTPMSYVMRDGDLVFRTGAGRRVDALRESPRACVEVARTRDHFGWESVVFWGDARFVEEPDERSRIVAALLAKYHTESVLGSGSSTALPEDRYVIVITPEGMLGRSSGESLSRQARPGRL